MTRRVYKNVAVDNVGNTLPGVQVEVRDSEGNLVTLYEAKTGATQAYSGANPFLAGDGNTAPAGEFEFWLESPAEVTVTVGTAPTDYTMVVYLDEPKEFANRQELVDWWTINSGSTRNGLVFNAGGVSYLADDSYSAITDLVGLKPFGGQEPYHWGAVGDGVADDTAPLNSFLAAGGGYVRQATYVLSGDGLSPVSNSILDCAPGVVFLQKGTFGIKQTSNSLDNFHMPIKPKFVYDNASPNPDHWLLSLQDHSSCSFAAEFANYTQASLWKVFGNGLGDENILNNSYDITPSNFSDARCVNGFIAAGHDATQFIYEGTGNANPIVTNVVWPEQFNSSVNVIEWIIDGGIRGLKLNTDYTVSYDGSNNLIVTPVSPIAVGTRWFLYTAQPEATGRTPITNNKVNIECDPSAVGIGYLRWVDNVDHTGLMRLSANGAQAVVTNPGDEQGRGGQAGDYLGFNGLVLSFTSDVTDISTCLGFNLGPGSTHNAFPKTRYDKVWVSGGVQYGIRRPDASLVTIPGATVATTSGSPTVTVTGADPRDWITLYGSTTDKLVINGTYYNILAIDATTITLSANVAETASGLPFIRGNTSNYNSGYMDAVNGGFGVTNLAPGQIARWSWGSSNTREIPFTLPAGSTTVDVRHGAWRTPTDSEIQIFQRHPNVDNLTNNAVHGKGLRWSVVNNTLVRVAIAGGSHTNNIDAVLRIDLSAPNAP